MADNIAARLRHYANDCEIMCDDVLLHEAADEIDRLWAALTDARSELAWLESQEARRG